MTKFDFVINNNQNIKIILSFNHQNYIKLQKINSDCCNMQVTVTRRKKTILKQIEKWTMKKQYESKKWKYGETVQK